MYFGYTLRAESRTYTQRARKYLSLSLGFRIHNEYTTSRTQAMPRVIRKVRTGLGRGEAQDVHYRQPCYLIVLLGDARRCEGETSWRAGFSNQTSYILRIMLRHSQRVKLITQLFLSAYFLFISLSVLNFHYVLKLALTLNFKIIVFVAVILEPAPLSRLKKNLFFQVAG